jgi:hypothetical protein
MSKWKIACALAITLFVLAAPSGDARGDRPCSKDRVPWVRPNGLIIRFNVEMDEAFLELFEADLDWIEQNQPIHELIVWLWLTNIHSAFVGPGPEARTFRPVPREAAEGRLGRLKAALEDLPYVDGVYFNQIICLPPR